MTGQPFTLLVDITLKPGRADEFMALLNDVFEAMKVEETFVSASALRGAEDPNTILLCENWIDRENFMSVQLKRPYRDRYEARLPELLRSPPQIVLLRAEMGIEGPVRQACGLHYFAYGYVLKSTFSEQPRSFLNNPFMLRSSLFGRIAHKTFCILHV